MLGEGGREREREGKRRLWSEIWFEWLMVEFGQDKVR